MKISSDFRVDEVAGEYLLVNVGCTGKTHTTVFSINEPAAWLFRRIADNEFDEADLVKWILDEYDVSEDIAAQDVHDMVMLWKEYGILAK